MYVSACEFLKTEIINIKMLKVVISWWWILTVIVYFPHSFVRKNKCCLSMFCAMKQYGVWTESPLEQCQRPLRLCPHPGCSVTWEAAPWSPGSGRVPASLGSEWHNPSWFLGPGPVGTEATRNYIKISGLWGLWEFTPSGLRSTCLGQECGRGKEQR